MAVVIQTLFGLEVKNHHCTLSLVSMCLLQMWFRSSMCLDRWSRHGDWSHCFQSCRCILAHFENVATVCYMLNEDFGHVGHLIFTSYTDHYFITQVTPECRIWTNLWKRFTLVLSRRKYGTRGLRVEDVAELNVVLQTPRIRYSSWSWCCSVCKRHMLCCQPVLCC